jgi:phosphoacetylglucosamine mutase
LVIDCANGVGYNLIRLFKERLGHSANFKPILINTGDGILNENCGADYVKMKQEKPLNYDFKNYRLTSFDGDADRLVYGYSEDQFTLLDGDRIACLFALFIKDLLKESNMNDKFSIMVVQTPYCNGASTKFLKSQGIDVAWTSTGVKHLHHEACKHDIGIYFEANGHGGIIFSEKFRNFPNVPKRLQILPSIINQFVGDAVTNMLLVESILAIKSMTIKDWVDQFEELSNIQIKVKVNDKSLFVCTNADTILVEPANIQNQIDDIVKKYKDGRSFIRPSGTEDIVRIYAEAKSKTDCNNIIDQVSKLIMGKY